jgi:ribosomal protein S12 methylthiotransferase
MAECEKVCKYIDLPLQHASASVLARMKRPGNGDRYRTLLDRIRSKVPGVALRTTFIVGFPGETKEEFAELLAFVRAVAFDHVGVFTYSHEEGTSAYGLADTVPPAEKQRRRRRVLALQRRIVARTHRRRVGERVRVLIDGPSPEHDLVVQGRLEGQAPDIDPVVYLTDGDASELLAGTLVEATIVASKGYDLVARPLPVALPVCYSE